MPKKQWQVGKKPRGLSVNRAFNLIVTCTDDSKLQEYTKKGKLVREMSVHQSASVLSPWHAIQLSSAKYAIIHSGYPGVVTVQGESSPGKWECTGLQTVCVGEIKNARGLAVTQDDDILVADRFNNRVVQISSSGRRAQVLTLTIEGGLQQPVALCWDEARRRLYVGELKGRVLVFDNVNVEWKSQFTKRPASMRQ